ncbi:MAG: hypothetical protein AB8C84_08570 [Oligoflexales bacterium]
MEVSQYINLEYIFWIWWVWAAVKKSYEFLILMRLSNNGKLIFSRVRKSLFWDTFLWGGIGGIYFFSSSIAFAAATFSVIFQKHWRWRQWACIPFFFDALDVLFLWLWGFQQTVGLDVEIFYVIGATLCATHALVAMRIPSLLFYTFLGQALLVIALGRAVDVTMISILCVIGLLLSLFFLKESHPFLLSDLSFKKYRYAFSFFWMYWLGSHSMLVWCALHWFAENVTLINSLGCGVLLILEGAVIFRCPWLRHNEPTGPLEEGV